MNNLETWTKYDTYFIIVSCVISFILIGFGLMRYSNLLVKFIFFGIVASLLFFLFRYLKNANIIFPDDGEVWHPNNKSSDTTVSAEDTSSDTSPTDNIEEFTSSEIESETESNPTNFKLTRTDNDYNFKATTVPSPILATTDEAGIVSEEEDHISTKEENYTSVEEEEYHHTSVEEEDHYHHKQQMRFNEIRQLRLGESQHHTTIEEEGMTVEEEDCVLEEDGQCKQFVDHKKKVPTDGPSINKHIGIPDRPDKNTMTPYQSPVNINVSYISKNSVSDSNFAKDDIVTNSKLGTPGSNSYGNSRPSDLNQRLTIDNNNANRNSNSNSNRNSNVNNNSNRNNNRNDNRNNNENCIGPSCRGSRPLPVPDEAYTNSGYSYLNPEYQGLDGDTTGGSCNNGKCHVCPMEINQNWSKWKPNYLSGDDTKN